MSIDRDQTHRGIWRCVTSARFYRNDLEPEGPPSPWFVRSGSRANVVFLQAFRPLKKVIISFVLAGLALGVFGLVSSNPSLAQEFPTGVVKIIVPFPPGGGADIFSRKLADVLSKQWDKSVVVENISGGANIVGILAAIRAPADGHTMIVVPDVALSLYPLMYTNLAFNPDADLAPVTTVMTFPAMLAVTSSLPATTLKEFIELAKKQPLNYGSFGPGSAPNLHTELFKSLTGIDLLHVPYRGAAPLMTALMQKDIQLTIIGAGGIIEQIKSGVLRGLAVHGDHRFPLLPDVPTFKEAGLPAMIAPNWWGLMVPAKTPKAVIDRIARDVALAAKQPLMVSHHELNGSEAPASSPEELAKRIQDTRTFWAPIIKNANIRLE